jgi:hypothetical protein
MTYNGCHNAEFVKHLWCRLELVTSWMHAHWDAAQFNGVCEGDTSKLELSIVGKCKAGFFQVRTISIAVNMLIITEQFSFNCSGQTAICVRSRLTYIHSRYVRVCTEYKTFMHASYVPLADYISVTVDGRKMFTDLIFLAAKLFCNITFSYGRTESQQKW